MYLPHIANTYANAFARIQESCTLRWGFGVLLPPVTGQSAVLKQSSLTGLSPVHLGPFYLKCGPWTHPEVVRNVESHTLLNQNLYFSKVPWCFVHTLKFEKQ